MSAGTDKPSARRTLLASALITLVALGGLGFAAAVKSNRTPQLTATSDDSGAKLGSGSTDDSATESGDTTVGTDVSSEAPASGDAAMNMDTMPGSQAQATAVTTSSPADVSPSTSTIAPTSTSSSATSTSSTTTTTAASSTTTSTVPGSVPCPAKDGSSPQKKSFTIAPQICTSPGATYHATITTSEGIIKVVLNRKATPITANNFVFLARYHFYDGQTIHRAIPDFIIQGGDPLGNGLGTPGYEFADELPKNITSYPIGALAMANGRPQKPNTNGSQFFITVGALAKQMPLEYPMFGKVTEGLDVAKKIANLGPDPSKDQSGKPSHEVIINRITIEATNES